MNSSNTSTDVPWTESSPQTGVVPMEQLLAYTVAMLLWKFYPPVVILLGTFGNVMSIVIMSRMTSAESTVNIFFIVIATGDLLVLFSGMMMSKWLEVTFHLDYTGHWSLLYYFLRWWVAPTTGPVVGWTLVCLTLQRALAVVWPHHVSRICTRGRVRVLLGGVAVSLIALYSHYLYCLRVEFLREGLDVQGVCLSLSPEYAWFLDNVFSYVDLVVFSVLPFTSLVMGNSVLIWRLVRSTREARQSMATAAPNQRILKRRNQANTSVTFTVIVVSLTFIVLTFPCSLYLLLYHFKTPTAMTPEEAANVYLFFTISFLLADSNSAVNFYLYCLTGRRFRKEFVNILQCERVNEHEERNPEHSK